jgi:hypothetical protein
MEIKDELEDLYERWLWDNYSDEIHSKEDLIDKVCDGFMYDEFMDEVKKSL